MTNEQAGLLAKEVIEALRPYISELDKLYAAAAAVMTKLGAALAADALAKEAERDSKRLDWLAQSGACVAFSRDGDDCWLHWPYNPNDEEGEPVNQKGKFDSPRNAIDAAMGLAGKAGQI